MILIVGLGNPGKKFEKTRHNIGFQAVDEIAANFQFPIFNFLTKLNAQISKGEIAGKKVILVKPQTFMNNSGKAVKLLTNKYLQKRRQIQAMASILRQEYENLWVIHDDIDIPLGKIKIVKNRGSAGHKGVQSIIDELGTKNFVRFRIGINPNSKFKSQKSKLQLKRQDFVLENFNKKEEKIVKEVIKKTVEAIEFSLKEGIEKAMSKFNQ